MDFDPNSLGPLGGLLGGLQQKMEDMKRKASEARCTGEAGGGIVRVTMTGDYQVEAVTIAEGAMDDREMLEDLVRAATSDALRQVREQLAENMKELAGGLPIPPGLLNF
ncbi:MAG: YbaB/EbfC family nucleoid-associated protein [Myxococcota bacterium]